MLKKLEENLGIIIPSSLSDTDLNHGFLKMYLKQEMGVHNLEEGTLCMFFMLLSNFTLEPNGQTMKLLCKASHEDSVK